jgi:hypothetical protein
MTISSTPDGGAVLDDGVERGDDRLAALEREALLADVFRVQEFLEELGLVDAAEDADFLRLGEGGLVARGLDALLQPAAAVGVLDVHVFDADVAAIGLLQRRDDVAQLHLAAAEVGAVSNDVSRSASPQVELRERSLGMRRAGGPLSGSRCAWVWPIER